MAAGEIGLAANFDKTHHGTPRLQSNVAGSSLFISPMVFISMSPWTVESHSPYRIMLGLFSMFMTMLMLVVTGTCGAFDELNLSGSDLPTMLARSTSALTPRVTNPLHLSSPPCYPDLDNPRWSPRGQRLPLDVRDTGLSLRRQRT